MLMDKLHGASNSIIWKTLFSLISVSFLLSGVAGYVFTRTDTSAVKVNGEEISQQIFQRQYNDEYQRLSFQLGAKFAAIADTPEFSEGLRQSVLNRLIDQELLRQYTKELKLSISDQRVKQEIVTTPAFQVNGQYDNNAYLNMLRENGMSPDTYAEYLREALRLVQLESGLADSGFLVPAQQDEFATLFFQQRKFRLANFPLADEIAKQTVTEQEISDYYNSNKSAFLVPELVKVQYLDLTPEAVEKLVKVTDVDIQQYYQDNKAQFVSKGQERLAHIEFNNEKDALDAYQALQAGADFATLAKEKSIDKLSAAKGGDLGWLSLGDLPKDFEDAALLLKVGQYGAPVKVENTYHIIKVEDRKGASELPLSDVKDQIAKQIRQDLLSNQFYSVEKQMAEKAFENQNSLQAAADVAGLSLKETAYFSRQDIPAELNFPSVVNAIFDGDVAQGNVNSEPMNVGEQHSILVRVLDHKAEAIKTLDEAKDDIAQFLKRQKAQKVVLENVQQLADKLSKGDVKPDTIPFDKSVVWTYAENKDPALNNIVFAMKQTGDAPSYKAAQANNGDVVLIQLEQIEQAKLSEQQRQALDTQLEGALQQDIQRGLIKALRAKAKIEINEEFMNQSGDN